MTKIEKLLQEWVSLNFVTKDQAAKIAAYESKRSGDSLGVAAEQRSSSDSSQTGEELKGSDGSKVVYGFSILGAIIIGIGIISVIAANWNNISDFVKLAADFALLVGLAYGAFTAWNKKKLMVFEILLVSLMIHALASIGLISQIYHTGGKLYQAVLMWSAITVGIAMASKKLVAPFLWTSGFFTALILYILDTKSALYYVFHNNEAQLFLAVPLLSAVFAVILKSFASESPQVKALTVWTLFGSLVSVFTMEIILRGFTRSNGYDFSAFLPTYTLSAVIAFAVALSLEFNKGQKILLMSALAIYVSFEHLTLFKIFHKGNYIENRGVIYYLIPALFSISYMMCMAVFMASRKYQGIFQKLLILIGLRFLVLYFQAFGGLAATGVGLIVSGILIIGSVVLWNKHRKRIGDWAEGVVK